MYQVPMSIALFPITELDKEAQRVSVEEHREFMLSFFCSDDYDFPYTYSEYKKDLTKAYVIENIEANNYLYFKDGEMAKTVRYCDGHPRSGEHVFEYNGEEYLLGVAS